MAATAKTHASRGKRSGKAPALDAPSASTVYKDFTRWSAPKGPSWHPVKKMRYVFWRMINGAIIRDALKELHWDAAEFWHLVDLKRHAPFRVEYQRAKLLHGRAMADSITVIAEGRDAVTRKHKKSMDKMIAKAIRRISSQKSLLAQKALLSQLLGDLREHDKIIISRNKLQVDAAKWTAEKISPSEYGQKSTMALGSPDGEASGALRPIQVQFIGPDGKAVAL